MSPGVTPGAVEARQAAIPQKGSTTPAPFRMRCPECLAPSPAGGMFCGKQHKQDFNNRQTVRGRVLTALEMAAYITRHGSRRNKTIGASANRQRRILMQRWIDEDRAAGRMMMDDYLAQRVRYGSLTYLELK